MTTSNGSTPSVIRYFIDEAGDPTLFDRRGRRVLVGDGSSKYFMLGKLEIAQPDLLTAELDALRNTILADPYFDAVPSMQPERKKTAIAFHAKDDLPEVRHQVFQVLRRHDLRFYAVIKNKMEVVAYVQQREKEDASYRFRPNDLYDTLVRDLFKNLHGLADRVEIVFAKRGNKPRTDAFSLAIKLAEKDFERGFGFTRKAETHIRCSTPKEDTCLQAADYFLWALQRHYERGESRYIKSLWAQVGEIHDQDAQHGRRRGVYYNRNNPPWESGEGGA